MKSRNDDLFLNILMYARIDDKELFLRSYLGTMMASAWYDYASSNLCEND